MFCLVKTKPQRSKPPTAEPASSASSTAKALLPLLSEKGRAAFESKPKLGFRQVHVAALAARVHSNPATCVWCIAYFS